VGAKKILLSISRFLSASLVGRAMALLVGFVIARVVSPYELGLYGTVLTVLLYAENAHLGIVNGFVKQYPIEQGRGETEDAERLRDGAYTSALGASCVGAIGIAFLTVLLGARLPEPVQVGLLLTAVAIPLMQNYTFHYNLLRAEQDFRNVSRMTVVRAALEMCLGIGLVLAFGLYGVLIAIALVALGLNAYTYALVRQRPRLRFEARLALRTWKLGLPIFLVLVGGWLLFRMAGRTVIMALLPPEELGYFQVASMLQMTIWYVPFSVGFVLYPTMLEKLGATGRHEELGRYLFRPTALTSALVAVLAGIAWVCFEPVVAWVLPEYLPGVSAAKILVLAVFFWSIAVQFNNFLIAVDRRRPILIALGGSIAAAALIGGATVKMGLGIAGVAGAVTIAVALYSF